MRLALGASVVKSSTRLDLFCCWPFWAVFVVAFCVECGVRYSDFTVTLML